MRKWEESRNDRSGSDGALHNGGGSRITYYTVFCLFLTLYLNGCGPAQVERQKTLDNEPARTLMNRIGHDFETLAPSKEEEGLVVNHMQHLWHYLTVSQHTTMTFKRVYYAAWGKEKETIVAQFDHPTLGTITITAEDSDLSENPGVDTGTIRFSEKVEMPEKGYATGEFYPFGGGYQGITVPPSFHLKLPGGYFVPAGGLLDYTKRHMHHDESITVLQTLVRDVFTAGTNEVPRPGDGE